MDRISASQINQDKTLPLALAGKASHKSPMPSVPRHKKTGRALRRRGQSGPEKVRNGTLGIHFRKWFGTDITQP